MYPTAADRKLKLIQQIADLQDDVLVQRLLEILRKEEVNAAESHIVTDTVRQEHYVQHALQAEADRVAGRVHSHASVEAWIREQTIRE